MDLKLNGILVALACLLVVRISGHGYMSIPAARNYCGKAGIKGCVTNYTPNELNCGGRNHMWSGSNNGKCGTCGDPYGKTQKHIQGGMFAKGVITHNYKQGETITVQVTITANHQGWFEFRVGDISSPPITNTKLKYLLTQQDGKTTRWQLKGSGYGIHTVKLQLPPGLHCRWCVLQWYWRTGNSWGCDEEGCGLGHGKQETFVNCADITITKDGTSPPSPPTQAPPPPPTQAPRPPPTQAPPPPPTQAPPPPTTQSPTKPPNPSGCKAIGAWAGKPGMDSWCVQNCALGNCPSSHCLC